MDQTFSYLRRLPAPGSVSIARLTQLQGAGPNLEAQLDTDPRFSQINILDGSKLVHGVQLSSLGLCLPLQNPLPKRPQAVAAAFARYLEACSEEELKSFELENLFQSRYDKWKNYAKVRGGYSAIKNVLLSQGKIVVYRNRILFNPSTDLGQPTRVTTRCNELDNELGAFTRNARMLSNKGGLEVSDIAFDGVLRVGEACRTKVSILNTSNQVMHLQKLYISRHNGVAGKFLFLFGAGSNAGSTRATVGVPVSLPVCLAPHSQQPLELEVQFTAEHIGLTSSMVMFTFWGGTEFSIGRIARVSVEGDPDIQQMLAPTAPYIGKKKQKNTGNPPARADKKKIKVEEGERPAGADMENIEYIAPPNYKIPADWRELSKQAEAGAILADMRDAMSADTMVDLFHKNLWAEELQMNEDIRHYDKVDKLHRRGSMLALNVPNLAEKRPSVLKGDKVFVSYLSSGADENEKKYSGYVHQVERDQVLLKFSRGFHASYKDQNLNIEFTFNRMTLRLCHQAIDNLTPSMKQYLTPSIAPPAPHPAHPATVTASGAAGATAGGGAAGALPQLLTSFSGPLNDIQMQAVRYVVHNTNEALNCPYVIFGPPGTGN
jgi:hypothetical protein